MIGDDDLRDCFAMFALCGILSCDYSVDEEPAKLAYKYADEMMEARRATSAVVPLPPNGSNIVPPSGHPAKTQGSISSFGNVAKWASE